MTFEFAEVAGSASVATLVGPKLVALMVSPRPSRTTASRRERANAVAKIIRNYIPRKLVW
jgi:hypothetical protein